MFQNVKKKWLAKQEEKLFKEFDNNLKEVLDKCEATKAHILSETERIQSDLILKQRDVEDLLKRTNDKKIELEKKNQELADQIRLIEAKASPDAVWATAFQAGFQKCWDVMWEFQSEQVVKLKDKIRSQAINETLGRLNGDLLPKTK